MKERLPSIHIRKDHLVIILREVFSNDPELPFQWNHEEIADDLLKRAKRYSVSSRSITVSNDKLVKQAHRIKVAAQSDTSLFSLCLVQTRRKHHHRGINQIQVGEPEWLQTKEVCSLATEFCNEFGLSKKVGYLKYCEMAMSKMKNYSLNKFKSLHPVLCQEYEANLVIKQDENKRATERAHDIYCALISERTGFSQGYQEFPIKYQYFVKAAQEASKLKVNVDIYIKAQFYYSDFTNQVPDPLQLIGPKAIDRLQKYCFENSIKVNEVKTKLNWEKIRKG